MNERIKELEKQSTTVVEGWSDENGTTRYYEFNREKFAELIVKECVQILQDNTPVLDENESLEDWNKGYIRAMLDCEHHIQEHFGVEGMSTEDKKNLIKELLGVKE